MDHMSEMNRSLRGGPEHTLSVCKAEVVAIYADGEESPCAAVQQTVALAPA